MTIQQCRYILEIAKRGSFNEAATSLFISQASLSESTKNLENHLGIKIFARSNKGVCLTKEGGEFIKYARQIVSQADLVEERYASSVKPKRLFISSQHYDFAAEVFSKFLNTVKQEHFMLSLRETKTNDVIQEVKSAQSDIGIIALKKTGDQLMERYLKKNKLIFTPLTDARPHVFMKKTHPLKDKSIINDNDLSDYPYIFYEQGDNCAVQFSEELSDYSCSYKNIEINDRATLMNLLLSTDCYTIGTGIMSSELNNGNIISIPLDSASRYSIGYIIHENAELTSEAILFLDMLKEFLKNHCPDKRN